jgi:hypothetical protein
MHEQDNTLGPDLDYADEYFVRHKSFDLLRADQDEYFEGEISPEFEAAMLEALKEYSETFFELAKEDWGKNGSDNS